MTTLNELIAIHHILMNCERTDSNPNAADGWQADHWKCILSAGAGRDNRKRMTVYFSKGYGHNGKQPSRNEVLDCLASDASGFENARGFEDWCGDYGYDTDSRKAEKTFRAIEKQSSALKRLLGEHGYETLLWQVERE